MDIKTRWKCLLNYALRRGLSYQDAEDFAQFASTAIHFGRKATTYHLLVDFIRKQGAMWKADVIEITDDIPDEQAPRVEVSNPFEVGSRKWEIFDLYFNKDYTFGDIARKFGICKSGARDLLFRSIDIIKNAYKNEY